MLVIGAAGATLALAAVTMGPASAQTPSPTPEPKILQPTGGRQREASSEAGSPVPGTATGRRRPARTVHEP